MAVWWTNTSGPSLCEMKPKPFSALNHFTVPVATSASPLRSMLSAEPSRPVVGIVEGPTRSPSRGPRTSPASRSPRGTLRLSRQDTRTTCPRHERTPAQRGAPPPAGSPAPRRPTRLASGRAPRATPAAPTPRRSRAPAARGEVPGGAGGVGAREEVAIEPGRPLRATLRDGAAEHAEEVEAAAAEDHAGRVAGVEQAVRAPHRLEQRGERPGRVEV